MVGGRRRRPALRKHRDVGSPRMHTGQRWAVTEPPQPVEARRPIPIIKISDSQINICGDLPSAITIQPIEFNRKSLFSSRTVPKRFDSCSDLRNKGIDTSGSVGAPTPTSAWLTAKCQGVVTVTTTIDCAEHCCCESGCQCFSQHGHLPDERILTPQCSP